MPEPKLDENLRVAFLVYGKPDLKMINKNTPLSTIIQDLIESHKLDGSVEDFALIFQVSDKIKEFRIVTEKDRDEMHGIVVELGESPTAASVRILGEIEKVIPETNSLTRALEDLRKMSVDPTFCTAFFGHQGLALLMHGVSSGKFRDSELGLVLDAFNSLLEHEAGDRVEGSVVADQVIEKGFVKMLVEQTAKGKSGDCLLATRCALGILATFARESETSREMIDKELAVDNIITLFGNSDSGLQLAALNLINSLLQHALNRDRKAEIVRTLQKRTSRDLIIEKMLVSGMSKEMGQQLYLMQHHQLSLVHHRLYTKIEPQDGHALQKIKDLRSTAFDTGSPTIKNNTRYAQDHKKLGFTNVKDPSLDFLVTPPGVLALDCMDYFAKFHTEQFMKVVLENSCRSDNHECPFAASSIELVRLLANILGIGQPATPHSSTSNYHEMFYKSEHPFEEFFSYCVVLLNKTWREMRATKEDFNKVFDVVAEQIDKSLNSQERPKTFDQFRSNVKSYGEISRRWQSDAKNRDAWAKSAAVAELRQHLVPEIEDLIRQQRANFMVEGTRFHRYKKSGEPTKQSQYRFVKLHTNHKTIYVGDWNHDKSLPTIEDLEPKMQISEVRDLKTGPECPFLNTKEWKSKETTAKLAFSLLGENSSLDLVAPDEQTFHYWVDGINNLIQRPMDSPDYQKEKDVLLEMEIKLRLLDLEGVELPETAPEIPPPPPDFNFSSC